MRVPATHRHLQTRAHICKVRLMPTAGQVGVPGQGACSGKLRQRCSCRGQVLSRAGLWGEGDSPGGEPAGHRPQRTCPPVYCSARPRLHRGSSQRRPSPASSFQDRGCLRPAGAIWGNQGPTPAWPEEQAPPSSQVLGPRGPLQVEGVPPRSRASPLLVSTAPSGLGRGDLEQPPGRRGQLSQSSGERAWRPRRRGLGGGERHRAGGHGRGALPDPAALGRGQAVAVGRAAAEQQQVERGAEWTTDLVCDLPTWMQTLLRFTTCFPSPSPEHGPGPRAPDPTPGPGVDLGALSPQSTDHP